MISLTDHGSIARFPAGQRAHCPIHQRLVCSYLIVVGVAKIVRCCGYLYPAWSVTTNAFLSWQRPAVLVGLINEYECVDPVHPLHIPTSNFLTVSVD